MKNSAIVEVIKRQYNLPAEEHVDVEFLSMYPRHDHPESTEYEFKVSFMLDDPILIEPQYITRFVTISVRGEY